jgi:hypothetical protein
MLKIILQLLLSVYFLFVVMLSVAFYYWYAVCQYAECHYDECHYAECRYAECRGAPKCYENDIDKIV